eukprot:TRINITY_DN1908_c0_g1_i1.p1 TRINITY_DN1908_c0_g1~~TRINITY_DN1908_c0_g1_i1.p1  ORF type:complete len:470 (-),score=121.22 TRINITY_DN1908_c0_g1_i1:597-1886(-)
MIIYITIILLSITKKLFHPRIFWSLVFFWFLLIIIYGDSIPLFFSSKVQKIAFVIEVHQFFYCFHIIWEICPGLITGSFIGLKSICVLNRALPCFKCQFKQFTTQEFVDNNDLNNWQIEDVSSDLGKFFSLIFIQNIMIVYLLTFSFHFFFLYCFVFNMFFYVLIKYHLNSSTGCVLAHFDCYLNIDVVKRYLEQLSKLSMTSKNHRYKTASSNQSSTQNVAHNHNICTDLNMANVDELDAVETDIEPQIEFEIDMNNVRHSGSIPKTVSIPNVARSQSTDLDTNMDFVELTNIDDELQSTTTFEDEDHIELCQIDYLLLNVQSHFSHFLLIDMLMKEEKKSKFQLGKFFSNYSIMFDSFHFVWLNEQSKRQIAIEFKDWLLLNDDEKFVEEDGKNFIRMNKQTLEREKRMIWQRLLSPSAGTSEPEDF